MEDASRTPTGWHQPGEDVGPDPDPAGLGALGVVIGAVSTVFALTHYLTLVALLGGVVALVLGALALTDDRSRGVGAGAVAVATLALTCAALVLVSLA